MRTDIRTTLSPGDLLFWTADAEEENAQGAPLLVSEDGESLWFQFNPHPWHEQEIAGVQGLTVHQAEQVLRGELEWTGPGHLYKSYDAELDVSFGDPEFDGE